MQLPLFGLPSVGVCAESFAFFLDSFLLELLLDDEDDDDDELLELGDFGSIGSSKFSAQDACVCFGV